MVWQVKSKLGWKQKAKGNTGLRNAGDPAKNAYVKTSHLESTINLRCLTAEDAKEVGTSAWQESAKAALLLRGALTNVK